jgi:hypothetical protein
MSSTATIITDEQALLLKIGTMLFSSPEYRDFRADEDSTEEEKVLASRNASILDVIFTERTDDGVEVSFENLKNIFNELVISRALRPLPGTKTEIDQQREAAFLSEQAAAKARKNAEGKWYDLELTKIESMSAAELKRLYSSDVQFKNAYDRLDGLSPYEKSVLRSEELAAKQASSPLAPGWEILLNETELLSTGNKNRPRGDYLLVVDDRFVSDANFARKTITLVKFPNMAFPYSLSDARLVIERLKNDAKVHAGLYHRTDGLK